MAAALRSLGSALRSSSPLLMTQTMERRCLSSLPYKQELTNYVNSRWSSLSQENRSMIKQSFINLTVPAVYSGIIWLVSAGADIVKDTMLDKGTLDEITALPAEVELSKKELDQKLIQLVKALEKVKYERDTLKSEISRVKGESLQKDEQIQMLRKLLAGNMGQMGIVWMKCFAKNLNHASVLSYYDPPEAIGLTYWNPN